MYLALQAVKMPQAECELLKTMFKFLVSCARAVTAALRQYPQFRDRAQPSVPRNLWSAFMDHTTSNLTRLTNDLISNGFWQLPQAGETPLRMQYFACTRSARHAGLRNALRTYSSTAASVTSEWQLRLPSCPCREQNAASARAKAIDPLRV